ncbi:MAG: GNAT family N-acetyltransferase, partial [Nanoarchaeota archaeon]
GMTFADSCTIVDEFEDISETYLNSNGDFLVAEKAGKITGTITYIIEENSAKLKRLYVDKNSQGLGIGQKLLDEIERIIKEKGLKKITLSSYKQMSKAQNFYLKNGFKITKTDGDRVYMEKNLRS